MPRFRFVVTRFSGSRPPLSFARDALAWLLVVMLFGALAALGSGAELQGFAELRVCTAQGCSGYGSAVNVGRVDADTGTWVFLTVAHNLRGANSRDVALQIRGEWRPAKWIQRPSTPLDVALVGVAHEAELRCAPLRDSDPQVGETVTLYGAGSGRAIAGTVLGPGQAKTSFPVKSGDSGGPVFDADGRLAGLIIGYESLRPHLACYTPCCAITAFLENDWGGLPYCGPWPPPTGPPTEPIQPPPQLPPPQAPAVSVDYDKLAELIVAKLADDERFRGRPGPAGAPGPGYVNARIEAGTLQLLFRDGEAEGWVDVGTVHEPVPEFDVSALVRRIEALEQGWAYVGKDGSTPVNVQAGDVVDLGWAYRKILLEKDEQGQRKEVLAVIRPGNRLTVDQEAIIVVAPGAAPGAPAKVAPAD
jgi:hypothetical protein